MTRSTRVRGCGVPGCERPAASFGLCTLHYGRWHRHHATGDEWADLDRLVMRYQAKVDGLWWCECSEERVAPGPETLDGHPIGCTRCWRLIHPDRRPLVGRPKRKAAKR